MPLAAGTKLGPYEILAPIGKGGMGEVYRARDTRLGRDVAVKISRERFSDRFEREARAVAALNHPNICQLYDVGASPSGSGYLVMELIEGESLDSVIKAGPMPLDAALQIAHQIADALEAAHEKNIVHRDLKPANIKITPGGTVKVLDFGLAKMNPSSDPGTDRHEGASPDESPTLTMDATQAGVILGTAAYMSPEQARGKKVDKRADIWAFGVVLHELLTGKKMFAGENVTDTLAAVIRAEPQWDGVPPRVLPLLKKCLEKDPKDRLRDIGDAWALLRDDATAPSAATPIGRKWLWPGIAAVFALAAAAATFLWIRASSQPSPPLARFDVAPPRDMSIISVPQISPDGQTLAFVAGVPGKLPMIFIRPLSERASRVLPGTEGAFYCYWSPDGRSLGFTLGAREIKRIELAGGAPRTLATTTGGAQNGTWGRQGDILAYTGGPTLGVNRLAASGGPLTPATRLDEKGDEKSHRFPQFLPDGGHFLFYVFRGDQTRNSVDFSTLGSFDRKQVLEGTSAAVYAQDSAGQAYLLYKRGETLLAQKFNEAAGAVTGEPVAVADNVAGVGNSEQQPQASASLTGTLVYAAGRAPSLVQLTWFDREGKVLGPVGDPGSYNDLVMSPDGTRAAVTIVPNPRSRDIWVLDLDRGIPTRLTSDGSLNESPVWSPDGKRIVFSSQRNGHFDLFARAADGAGNEELLLHSDQDKLAFSWSSDGRYLTFTSGDPPAKEDLWILPMEGERKPFVFLRTSFNEATPHFSQDGRWISYASDESGRYELYVRPFTPPGAAPATGTSPEGKWRISKDSATSRGFWRQDGKEFIFANLQSVRSAEVSTSPSFHASAPRELFQLPPNAFIEAGTPDLKKFLVAVQQAPPRTPITVVLNWPSAIK